MIAVKVMKGMGRCRMIAHTKNKIDTQLSIKRSSSHVAQVCCSQQWIFLTRRRIRLILVVVSCTGTTSPLVLFESPFTSVSTVSRGHPPPSLVSLIVIEGRVLTWENATEHILLLCFCQWARDLFAFLASPPSWRDCLECTWGRRPSSP